MRLKLYGRADCHLCEDMARALRALGVEFEEIDVGAVPSLEEKYGNRVPVLAGPGGQEICHYHLDETALRKALK